MNSVVKNLLKGLLKVNSGRLQNNCRHMTDLTNLLKLHPVNRSMQKSSSDDAEQASEIEREAVKIIEEIMYEGADSTASFNKLMALMKMKSDIEEVSNREREAAKISLSREVDKIKREMMYEDADSADSLEKLMALMTMKSDISDPGKALKRPEETEIIRKIFVV